MEAEPLKTEPPKRKRRWFQFSLRTLMIGVALLAVPMGYVGWQAKIVRERTEMLATIKAAGGEVMMLPSLPGVTLFPIVIQNRKTVSRWRPTVPVIRRWLGDDVVVFLVLNPSTSRKDIERVAALFPEAIISDGGDFAISYATSPPRIAQQGRSATKP